ncbi:universal stress protein, partial [Cognatishimia sp. 1_MG-2023]|uniref:universal stress protein n=1 Tax=Cognatishimia sp. 1_MG-2023 TaxID=3062642 RepID=UPI0026E4614C
EERHKRRREELERAETALMKPVVDALSGSGVTVESAIKYGNIAEQLGEIAKEAGASQVVIGRNGHSGIGSRVFGSVAGSLVQIAPVATTVVP